VATRTHPFSYLPFELRPELRVILESALSNNTPPKDFFDETSWLYYLSYVKPKLTKVHKSPSPDVAKLEVYVSPSYLVLYPVIETPRGTIARAYLFGVSEDGRVFVNRLLRPPIAYDDSVTRLTSNISIATLDDVKIYNDLGYDFDVAEKEEAVIDFAHSDGTRYRVQGDIVLAVRPWPEIPGLLERVQNYVERLLLDIVNRILIDAGLSTVTAASGARDSFILMYFTVPPRSKERYIAKLSDLIAVRLAELYGGEAIRVQSVGEVSFADGEFKGCHIRVGAIRDALRPDRFNPYLDLIIMIWCSVTTPLVMEIAREVHEAYERTPFTDMEFTVGNHHVKLYNVKSMSFSYRPRRQPLTLDELMITVRNPRTFLATKDSMVELAHPEHGVKTVRFAGTYIVRFEHVNVAPMFPSERNRVVLRLLEKHLKNQAL
jgi:hypothetical protein